MYTTTSTYNALYTPGMNTIIPRDQLAGDCSCTLSNMTAIFHAPPTPQPSLLLRISKSVANFDPVHVYRVKRVYDSSVHGLSLSAIQNKEIEFRSRKFIVWQTLTYQRVHVVRCDSGVRDDDE